MFYFCIITCRHDVGIDDPSDNLENEVGREEKIPSTPSEEDDGMRRQTSKKGKKRGKDKEAVVIGAKLSKPAPDKQMSMKKTPRTVASPSSIPAPPQQSGPDQPPPLNVPLNERKANPSKQKQGFVQQHVEWQVDVTSQDKVAAEQICNGTSCGWCQMEKRPEFMQLCSVCRSVAYCGLKCQKEGWPTHKKICKNMPGVGWDVKVKLVSSVLELLRLKLKRKSRDNQDTAAKRYKQPLQSQHKEPLLPANKSSSVTQPLIDSKEPLQSQDAEQPQQMTEEKLESPAHDDNARVFAKFISFPYWPAKVISTEGSGVNVQFPDGSTSGSGGAVRKDRILPFDKKSAESIVRSTKFKSGNHSLREFKKACEKFGLET